MKTDGGLELRNRSQNTSTFIDKRLEAARAGQTCARIAMGRSTLGGWYPDAAASFDLADHTAPSQILKDVVPPAAGALFAGFSDCRADRAL
ncbi:MAG: hypothetical protein ACJASV_001319 [Pseudorhodobacter sp.]|jgi:hypothetical protein